MVYDIFLIVFQDFFADLIVPGTTDDDKAKEPTGLSPSANFAEMFTSTGKLEINPPETTQTQYVLIIFHIIYSFWFDLKNRNH